MPPEVAFADLQFIIEFVYRGEIDVSEAELQVSKIVCLSIECVVQHCVDLENNDEEAQSKFIENHM